MESPTSRGKRVDGRILAIDYGRKRLGLALSDELRLLARPLATLERANRRSDLARLSRIAAENAVALIVVGLPLLLDGTASRMAEEASAFATRLTKAIGLRVELVDERLTSWEAEASRPLGKSPAAKRRGAIDQRAAVLILEEYLRRGAIEP
jgi:putative Holliday junction resolvase